MSDSRTESSISLYSSTPTDKISSTPLTPVSGSDENILPSHSQPAEHVHFENGLVQDDFLKPYGLAINPVHKLYICTSCPTSLTRSSYRRHLKDQHFMMITQAIADGVDEVSEMHDIVAEYPMLDLSEGPIAHIAGLAIDTKSGCPLCMYTAGSKRVQKHIREVHPNSGVTPIADVSSQVLNPGAAPTNIRVIPPVLSNHDCEDVVTIKQDYESFDLDAFAPVTPSDNRMVAPWLLRTGFHQYVQGHDTEKLIQLCSLPSASETKDYMANLHKLVLEYMDVGTGLIKETDPLVLQMLNTAEPDKDGINHTPFHEHHQHKETVKDYVLPVVHLLCALLRKGFDSFTLPSSTALDRAISGFRSYPTTQKLHIVLLALWTNRWQRTQGNMFLDPTICFLAIHTLRKEGHFLQPKDVTPIIAKLCRAIRICVLTEVHSLVEKGSFATALEAFKSLSNYVQEGHPTTFHVLRFFQHYATSIAMQTVGLPKIVWPFRDQGRYDTMLFMGKMLSLFQLRATVVDVERQIKQIWEHSILRGLHLHVPHSIHSDNLRDTSRGYSFLCNPEFQHYHKTLAAYLFGNPDVKGSFVQQLPGQQVEALNVAGIRAWLQDLAKLEGLLMMLIEMKNGSPIRLSELASTLAFNTSSRTRNLMAIGTRIAIVRNYTKNTNNKQADSLIPSCMAAFDGDMEMQVHFIARPVAQYMVSKLLPDEVELVHQYRDMLFMDYLKPFTTKSLSNVMGKTSAKHVGWGVTGSPYRQAVIGFRNKHDITPLELDIQEETMRLIYAQQSGHTLATEERIYGLSPELVEGVSDATMELYMQSSIDWQNLLGTVPGNITLPYWECTSDMRESLVANGTIKTGTLGRSNRPIEQDNSAKLTALLMQVMQQSEASHKLLLDSVNDLRKQVDALQNVQQATQSEHTQAIIKSKKVHGASDVAPQALGSHVAVPARRVTTSISTNPPIPNVHKRPREITSTDLELDQPSMKRATYEVPKTNVPKDMVHYLSRLLRKEASWRNMDQKAAVASMLRLRRDLIVILRTGLGKTAIALLPPMVEEGVTVVVVPLIILLEEWSRRLEESLIPYDIFLHDRTTPINPAARVVLVSSDTARFQSWKAAIASLHDIRPVIRMIIDEAHYYFTDSNFRTAALANPFTLRTLPFQLVLLSATIPPQAETHLKKEFLMHVPYTIRGLSHRRELKYRILPGLSTTEEMVDCFCDYRDRLEMEQKWTDRDRWIVFVSHIDEGKDVAERLGVEFYHAHSEENPITRGERQNIYGRFLDGTFKGLVASTALGAGTDYPHIRLSCHLGAMYGMVNFVQQSSRSGRDGQTAHCIVIPNSLPPSIPDCPLALMTGIKSMHELVYIQTHSNPQKICIRRQIGKTVDGAAFDCFDFDIGWQLCGICEQVVGVTPEFFTGKALARIDPVPTTAPLLQPPCKLHQDLRKEMWDNFGSAVEEAQSANGQLLEEKGNELDVYKRVIDAVRKDCGICWINGQSTEHEAYHCPRIGNREAYKAFRKMIKYKPKGYRSSPCWKCHICSFGGDFLHAQFAKGDGSKCPCPNLLPGLLFHCWTNASMQRRMETLFGKRWTTIEAWAAFLAEKDEEHSTRSMELVAWLGENYI